MLILMRRGVRICQPALLASPLLQHPADNVGSKTVWTVLLTNTSYLPGLLTLDHSLKLVGSTYPLLVLYPPHLPAKAHHALDARRIHKIQVPYLLPSISVDYSNDPRFYDCWSKLTPFSLTRFDRVVQLDADMLVRRNMDELMDLELDPPESGGTGGRVFAAGHACACNPLKKPHYPADWIPENCAFTTQHGDPATAQKEGAPCTAGIKMPNGGLQVVNPSEKTYKLISDQLAQGTGGSTQDYAFADQSLLCDLFEERWVALPYIYNALKTLRWRGIHDTIWRDDEVKCLHYILGPKPWEENDWIEGQQKEAVGRDHDPSQWWWEVTWDRRRKEKERGISDGY